MEEWKEYKYSDLCLIIGGGTPKTSVTEYWNGNIPWLSVKDFNGDKKYVYETEKTITEKGLNNSSTKLLQKDDIIISARGTVGEIAMIPFPMAFNQSCFGIRANSWVNNHFLYYITKTKIEELKKSSHGSVFDTITRDTFEKLLCSIPSFEKQKRIADILSSLDDKIELNRRINENLEQQAQALFKSWFVDFEPFKDGKFVDSELGMIPEGWSVGVLADIANITMGQSPKGTSYNEIGDGISFYQGRAEFGNRFPSVRLFTTEPSRYAEPYSVLLSVRAPVGDINIAVERCCIGRGLASILSKNKHQSFVLYTMFFLKKELDKFNSEGTVFGSINRSSLENLKIIIPPVDIIDKFENLTSKIDVMLLNLFQETTSLAQLRDTLLPRLMSGELEIKDNSYD